MESRRDLVGRTRLPGNFLQKRLSTYLDDTSHIMAIKSVINLKVLSLTSALELNPLREVVGLRRIALLHDDLYHVFALE
jgi:hypothetical protein